MKGERRFPRTSELLNLEVFCRIIILIVNIYVGNLTAEVTNEELQNLFEPFGRVDTAAIIRHRGGESRGFGFVEMPSHTEAQAAIAGLNGKEVRGQSIIVNEARPKEDRRGDRNQRFGRGGSGGGSGGRGGMRGGPRGGGRGSRDFRGGRDRQRW